MMKPLRSDRRVEYVKFTVYQRGVVLGVLITAAALLLMQDNALMYPLEAGITGGMGLFCLVSLILFRTVGMRYVSVFEWLAIAAASLFFMVEFWRATLLQTEWFNLQSSIFLWMPLIYIFTFLVLPNRFALWLSFTFFASIAGIGIIAVIVNTRASLPAPDLLVMVQVYGSNLLYISLLHSIALLRDRYGEAQLHSERMTTLAMVDELTGLSNRRKLDQTLEVLVQQSLERGRPLSVIMLDVDNFKQINDEFGHDCGDMVLRRVAELLYSNIRESDEAGRWGGDEFMVCSPETTERQVPMLCRRLSEAIARAKFPNVSRVTISFGAATLGPTDTTADLWKRADVNLLHSKREKTQRVSENGL